MPAALALQLESEGDRSHLAGHPGRRFAISAVSLREMPLAAAGGVPRLREAGTRLHQRRSRPANWRSTRASTVLVEGNHSAHLYTVLSGWGFRYKLLPDGRRQILNFVMPGDLIGLQGSLMGEMQHSVEALSPMLLCVFERDNLFELYRNHPGLAFDITWIASREEQDAGREPAQPGAQDGHRAGRLSARLHPQPGTKPSA